jgi:predicted glycosyltransferase
MKVFIDILTPKQGMLFSKLSKRLRENGHSIFEITREYREATQLLSLKGIKALVVGKHGGENLSSKLTASAERTLKLTSIMTELRPDVAVSFSSPETSRVTFGLGIPHVCINDSPHAEAVARLTVPLATWLLTPKAIPKNAWTKFGIASKKIIQYNALDSWAWLKDLKPDEKILAQLNLEKSKSIVAFRPEESFASYLLGKTSKTPSLLPLIEGLLKSGVDFQAVVFPRYETQHFLKEKLGEHVRVCESVVDAPSLLYYSSVFIGAGGTMTSEAALLGVPTFSCYPSKPYIVEKYLIKKGLIDREPSLERVKVKVLKTLRNIESSRKMQAEKARRLTSSFEDPVDVIAKTIENMS